MGMDLVSISVTLGCIAVLILTMNFWLHRKYSYWQNHNIQYIKPVPLFGNLKHLLQLQLSFGELFKELYAHESSINEPVVGIFVFHTPALIIRSPGLIRQLLIKDFHSFGNRYEAADMNIDTLGALSLPLSKYPIWRESRKKISQFFTTGRLKDDMYPLMLKTAKDLELFIGRQFPTAQDSVTIEVKEMCSLFTTDLTALLLFGLSTNSLRHNGSAMRSHCRDLLAPNFLKVVHFFTIFFLPHLTGIFRAKVFSQKYSDFMRQLVEDVTKQHYRPDRADRELNNLIDLLLDLKENPENKFVQHPDFIVSQSAIFLLAGFETSSSLIAFTLYELAKQPQVQETLRQEIKDNCEMGECAAFPYERMIELAYLNQVVAEALRLYPAAAFINRECTPGDNAQGISLKPFVDFIIPKGMPAYISILGLQRDPKYWPNPDRFDPARFSSQNVHSINPMTYIPFGAGPHGCIGSRLGILQVKTALLHILIRYTVETCPQTTPKIQFDTNSFMLQSEGGIHLRFVKDKAY